MAANGTNGTNGDSHSVRPPTLSTFSLQGRVAVVTGGAQGLGLVMSRALVFSGADVAIVDLNSMSLSTILFPDLVSLPSSSCHSPSRITCALPSPTRGMKELKHALTTHTRGTRRNRSSKNRHRFQERVSER
jgi:hypothetical protein